MHEELAARFKGVAAVNVAGAASQAVVAAAPSIREARPRPAGGRISSFIIGSAIGAALGFFGAHL
jgi:hypothetical protein